MARASGTVGNALSLDHVLNLQSCGTDATSSLLSTEDSTPPLRLPSEDVRHNPLAPQVWHAQPLWWL